MVVRVGRLHTLMPAAQLWSQLVTRVPRPGIAELNAGARHQGENTHLGHLWGCVKACVKEKPQGKAGKKEHTASSALCSSNTAQAQVILHHHTPLV